MQNNSVRESKVCPVCNRSFENRKRWSSRGIWNQIVYCSDKCRRTKLAKRGGKE